jgi:hypothetical protein
MNQLRFVEDATVIYRVSRAPERRVFYVDVGNMPRAKAEQYLKDNLVREDSLNTPKLLICVHLDKINDSRFVQFDIEFTPTLEILAQAAKLRYFKPMNLLEI